MLRKIRPIAKLVIGVWLAIQLACLVVAALAGVVLIANHATGRSSDGGILPILGETVAGLLVIAFMVWIAFDAKKALTELRRRREERRMVEPHNGIEGVAAR